MTSLEAVEVEDLDLSELEIATVPEPAGPSPEAWAEARRAIDEAWSSIEAWRAQYEDARVVTDAMNERLREEVASLRGELAAAHRRVAELEGVKKEIVRILGS